MIAAVVLGGLGLAELLILVVLVAAGVALVVIALKALGITLPQWFVQVLCVLAVAFVVILAIRILFSL